MLPNQCTTHIPLKPDDRKWWIVDLTDKPLGRVATAIANILRGKHKPIYSPNFDNGDFVIAINAKKVKLTGKKWDDKKYYNHSGYTGGLKTKTAKELMQRHPDQMLTRAVKGMLPKNHLALQLLTKLKVYGEAEHPHTAQQPKNLEIK